MINWGVFMIQRIEVCSWFSVVTKDQRNSLPFQPSLMSFCTKGLPVVVESTAAICGEQPSPWGEGALKGGWGVGKSALHRPSTIFCDGPTSPERRGLFFGWWILRLRLRLWAEWQGGRHAVKSESSLTRESDQKGAWHYLHWIFNHAVFVG